MRASFECKVVGVVERRIELINLGSSQINDSLSCLSTVLFVLLVSLSVQVIGRRREGASLHDKYRILVTFESPSYFLLHLILIECYV